jgi:two-component system response regulator AtoC
VKILRALQEQQIRRVGDEEIISIDVRVVAATLRDLEEDVENGRFRDDLYYRLNVVSLHIPPLRDRREDIPVLVDYLIKKQSKKLNLALKVVTKDAASSLYNHFWKGNVRELENCLERALVLSETDQLELQDLPEALRQTPQQSAGEESFDNNIDDDNLSIKQRTRALEMALILRALKKTKGNRTHAAKVLEISHRALLYKLKEYGLT